MNRIYEINCIGCHLKVADLVSAFSFDKGKANLLFQIRKLPSKLVN